MKNERLISVWCVHMRQRNLKDTTINIYRRHVKSFEIFIHHQPLLNVTQKQVDNFVDMLKIEISDDAAKKYMISLRVFYTWAYDSGKTVKNFVKLLPKFKEARKILKDAPTVRQVRKLILAPDMNTSEGYRARTMLIVTYAGGLRKSELLGLKLDDVNELKETIVIKRKGGHYQEIPIGGLAMEYLSTFINEVRQNFNPKCDFVFVNDRGKKFSDNIDHYFKKAAQSTGLTQYTPHSLRHAAATHMMKRGAELRGVQEFLGYRAIESTEIYTRVEPLDIRKVVDFVAFE